jgi:hypothetical protein
MFQAKVLADSINRKYDNRITTVELTYPRIIHSEYLTHRLFARNAASSRAIPVKKMIKDVLDNPFIPMHWGKNQSGMQAREQLNPFRAAVCRFLWMKLRYVAVAIVWLMVKVGLHKQIANRLLEPWMWITVIATGNSKAFRNFFRLRCHEDAEPHIQLIAYMLQDVYAASVPTVPANGWHLPLIGFDGDGSLSEADLPKVSTARCARVSYLTHDGRRDVSADIMLHDRLSGNNHWSPFEHVAMLSDCDGMGGNLGDGWFQYRKFFANECL